MSGDQLYVVCPYDYFEPGQAYNNLMNKLKNVRTVGPICGTVALDVLDTAQGKWFFKGDSSSSEENGMALVPSHEKPDTIGNLSIGNPSVGTNGYYFDFSSSGHINRRFSEVIADGNIYCYDNLRNREASIESGSGQAIQGYLFLQIQSDTTIKLERVDKNRTCPDFNSLSFSGNAVEFER